MDEERTPKKGLSRLKEGVGSLSSAIKERVQDEIAHHRKQRAEQKIIDEKIDLLAKKAYDKERERQSVKAAEQRARDRYGPPKPQKSYGQKFREHVGPANPFQNQPFLFGASTTRTELPRRRGKKGKKKGPRRFKTTHQLDPFGGLFGGL